MLVPDFTLLAQLFLFEADLIEDPGAQMSTQEP